ncbi:hypothetical protein [Cytobacillus oceanisediminis]|uniref:hypothetical protein n=1 Tax=Cytobacillus oceanisediminis TaxID=665099 RepID=UPI00203D08E8|nr:hypothetical protein [Cytobacillus oceanisediminis]MCM3393147.1 hypothetical protein [Cytobacillus oceanisediminis]
MEWRKCRNCRKMIDEKALLCAKCERIEQQLIILKRIEKYQALSVEEITSFGSKRGIFHSFSECKQFLNELESETYIFEIANTYYLLPLGRKLIKDQLAVEDKPIGKSVIYKITGYDNKNNKFHTTFNMSMSNVIFSEKNALDFIKQQLSLHWKIPADKLNEEKIASEYINKK